MNYKNIKSMTFLILFGLVAMVFLQNSVLANSTGQPPADCVRWYDGCNTCEVLDDEILSCTEIGCQAYNEPKCLIYQNEQPLLEDKQPHADCVRWYDGCNTCEVLDGEILSCTEIGCQAYNEPKCLEASVSEKNVSLSLFEKIINWFRGLFN